MYLILVRHQQYFQYINSATCIYHHSLQNYNMYSGDKLISHDCKGVLHNTASVSLFGVSAAIVCHCVRIFHTGSCTVETVRLTIFSNFNLGKYSDDLNTRLQSQLIN